MAVAIKESEKKEMRRNYAMAVAIKRSKINEIVLKQRNGCGDQRR